MMTCPRKSRSRIALMLKAFLHSDRDSVSDDAKQAKANSQFVAGFRKARCFPQKKPIITKRGMINCIHFSMNEFALLKKFIRREP